MLTARLDRLDGAKEIAQIASVIGNEFSLRLLRGMLSVDEQWLDEQLRKLAEAELLYEQSVASSLELPIQTCANSRGGLSVAVRSKRQEHHRKVAETLKARFPEIVEAQPELAADHYTSADLKEAALPYWQAAAANAMGARRIWKRSPT